MVINCFSRSNTALEQSPVRPSFSRRTPPFGFDALDIPRADRKGSVPFASPFRGFEIDRQQVGRQGEVRPDHLDLPLEDDLLALLQIGHPLRGDICRNLTPLLFCKSDWRAGQKTGRQSRIKAFSLRSSDLFGEQVLHQMRLHPPSKRNGLPFNVEFGSGGRHNRTRVWS
jgi:hypothetical protein